MPVQLRFMTPRFTLQMPTTVCVAATPRAPGWSARRMLPPWKASVTMRMAALLMSSGQHRHPCRGGKQPRLVRPVSARRHRWYAFGCMEANLLLAMTAQLLWQPRLAPPLFPTPCGINACRAHACSMDRLQSQVRRGVQAQPVLQLQRADRGIAIDFRELMNWSCAQPVRNQNQACCEHTNHAASVRFQGMAGHPSAVYSDVTGHGAYAYAVAKGTGVDADRR